MYLMNNRNARKSKKFCLRCSLPLIGVVHISGGFLTPYVTRVPALRVSLQTFFINFVGTSNKPPYNSNFLYYLKRSLRDIVQNFVFKLILVYFNLLGSVYDPTTVKLR